MNIFKLIESVNVTQMNIIEDCILNLQLKDNVTSNIEKIKDTLNKNFTNCTCTDISISDNNSTTVYGMRVYPASNTLESIACKLMDPKVTTEQMTKHITNMQYMQYVVEIDSNILYSKLYNFKPNEILSILLHEIGHVMADTDFYNELKSYYNEALFSLENRDLAKLNLSKKDSMVGILFIMSAIEKTRFQYNAGNSIKLEKLADKFVVEAGYGEALISTMNKFNKIYITQYKKSSKDATLQNEAEAFANLNMIFNTRKIYVSTMLDTEYKQTPSKFVKKMIKYVSDHSKKFMLKEGLNVVANVPMMDKEFINESFLTSWLSCPLKVSQRDIDDLKIESEMMEDYDDKSILVFKVHKRINQVSKTIESNNADVNTVAVAKTYVKQLNELLKHVMKFNATPTKYGVFIKYPKGYEG